jgi:hypothetical protein
MRALLAWGQFLFLYLQTISDRVVDKVMEVVTEEEVGSEWLDHK